MERSTSPAHPTPAVVRPDEPASGRPRGGLALTSRTALWGLGGVLAAVVLAIAAYAFATRDEETTDDAQVEADVVPIAPRTGGAVLAVAVQDNQAVKKGELLVELDPSDSAARLAQAEAELATAQAQGEAALAQEQIVAAAAKGGLSSARAMVSGSSVAVSSAGAQIVAAKAALSRATADAKKAELDLERTKELYTAGAVSKERLDNAQITSDAAKAALAQAEAGLTVAEEQKRSAETRVEEAEGRLAQSTPIQAQMAAAHAQAGLAEARVKAAEAAVALARNQLAYTKVTAPDDGVVSKLSVHPGQLVSPGAPIAELVPRRTYVVANFKETQLQGIRPGQRAEVKIDAYPGRRLEATVESISGGTGARFSLLPPDNATGNFVKVVQRIPVRVSWVDPPSDVVLRAGLSADVTVFTKR